MNNAQRNILIFATIAIAVIFLFPPFLHGKRYSGHRFLVAPPDGYGTIDFTVLALETLATVAFTGAVYLIAGGHVVGDEKNRFLFALPDAHRIGAHFFVHKRLKEIVFFPVSGSDSLTI